MKGGVLMAVTWAPDVDDVLALVQGWRHAGHQSDVEPLIRQATVEVVGEVDYFDPAVIINPDADADDQVTLGDLARNAAALRAAYQWASGLAPELSVANLDHIPSLHARYLDAVARLRRHVQQAHGGILEFTGSVRATRPRRGR